MKPDYKNWMPKGMVFAGAGATLVLGALLVLFAASHILDGTAGQSRL